MGFYSNLIAHLVVQFLVVLFLVVSVAGLAVGAGLIVSSQKTLQLFRVMNRWVSTRHVLKPVEMPRETEQMAHRYQRWVAGVFVLGGLIAIFGLAWRFDVTAISAGLVSRSVAPVVAIGLETMKWFLIIGSIFGVAIGLMLLFYPNAEVTLEKYANRWVSSRQMARGGDDMHMNLDRLVEIHPKPAGWIVACTSAAAVICAIIMLGRYY